MKIIEATYSSDPETEEKIIFFRGYITAELVNKESYEDSDTCENIGTEFLSTLYHFHDEDF